MKNGKSENGKSETNVIQLASRRHGLGGVATARTASDPALPPNVLGVMSDKAAREPLPEPEGGTPAFLKAHHPELFARFRSAVDGGGIGGPDADPLRQPLGPAMTRILLEGLYREAVEGRLPDIDLDIDGN